MRRYSKAAVAGAAAMTAELERIKEHLRHVEAQLSEWRERHTEAGREVERRGRMLEEAEASQRAMVGRCRPTPG